ncbi:hypothetical protein Gorai_000916 [Gossypium raimondii]|uniref:Uncharacterized protein n=1 Tax=Gossypium raimondii TaxID=29730 RepID=A0A7J8PEW3_GOSRA|nr:hypothetical protein [Gossypium raimondii]
METDFQSLLIHKKEEFELVLDSEAVANSRHQHRTGRGYGFIFNSVLSYCGSEEDGFIAHVHDLPSCFVSETLAKSIGNLMDQFVKYDVSSQRNFLNNFMRTRVRLDICVPHMRKKNIRAHSFGYVWIPFRREGGSHEFRDFDAISKEKYSISKLARMDLKGDGVESATGESAASVFVSVGPEARWTP